MKTLPDDPYAPLEPVVDIADIYHAYRLILGRPPDPHGWTGLSALAPTLSLEDLVSIFLTHPEFKQRPLFAKMLGEDPGQPVLAQAGSFALYVSPNDNSVGQSILAQGSHEPELTAALRRVLRAGMTFVDVGANTGYFSLLAAQLVGKGGQVVALEPNPRNCALLQLSMQHNHLEQIELWPVAAAEKRGAVVYDHLIGSNGLVGPNLDAGAAADAQLAHKLLAPAFTLDHVLHHAKRVDVIKLDIEGAEYRALQGALKILARHRPQLFTEFSPGWLPQISGVTGEAYLAFLVEQGYQFALVSGEQKPVNFGQSPPAVMEYFQANEVDHIDLHASPVARRKWWWFGALRGISS